MSGFQVPFSSSPAPSTPDSRKKYGAGQFSFSAFDPSTTPAGPPPPSSAGSFTPAGPPPSSVLGSSRFDGAYNNQPPPAFSFSTASPTYEKSRNLPFGSSPPSFSYGRPTKPAQRSNLGTEYQAPAASRATGSFSANLYDDDEEDAEGEQDENLDFDSMRGNGRSQLDNDSMFGDGREAEYLHFNQPGLSPISAAKGSRTALRAGELRRSREDDLMDFQRSTATMRMDLEKEYMFGSIAKDFYSRTGAAQLHEPDDLILRTEELMVRLYEDGIKVDEDEDALKRALASIPQEVSNLWTDYSNARAGPTRPGSAATIGPGPNAEPIAKANFLAALLLRLRHPGKADTESPDDFQLTSRSDLMVLSDDIKEKQIPAVILEWLDDFHNPYPSQLDDIQVHKPSAAAHVMYWPTIFNSLLRGRVMAVANSLRNAGWQHSRSSTDAGRDRTGFTGIALVNIERVINDAVQVLNQCPGMRGDWDVTSSDWTMFRLRAEGALDSLKKFAHGKSKLNTTDLLDASLAQSYSGIARKAESQVPWDIYQNLVTLYQLVLGDANAIIPNSQDWCEATLAQVVWWNPSKDRRLMKQSVSRSGDKDPGLYIQRLQDAFYRTTSGGSEAELQVNSLDPVEVGLASICEGNIEAVVGLMRTWSLVIASAVAEVGRLGDWLPRPPAQDVMSMGSLDQDDLNLLGIGQPSDAPQDAKDQTLVIYATVLAQRAQLSTKPIYGRPKVTRAGWEVAINVLGRLDSASRAEDEVSQLLEDFPLESSSTVDRLFRLLNDLGMNAQAENIALDYAKALSEDTFKYGEALWYYALAHKQQEVKDVLDLLISFSLLHSVAYPVEAEMDSHLQRLINSPKAALTELSKMDPEAAQLLHKSLSGYATLRRFYDLRDGIATLSEGMSVRPGTAKQRAEAAAALMAVITSSDDNIRGGLYDESRGAVVSIDFLLALLAEATVFVSQPELGVSLPQINILLKAIEDLQTVTPGIYAQCDEFFKTVVASTQGLKGSSPIKLLQKSTSNVSGNSFSLVGSSMFASQLQKSIGSSGVLVRENVKRGWDWRRGLIATTSGEDILQVLRYGLAKDLARIWVMEADGQL